MTTHSVDEPERKPAGISYPFQWAAIFLGDIRVALRSLSRTPALWATVALALALGIGANSAIFSVVRGVLLRPLMNREEGRLIYIQQSAPGLQIRDATFSIPRSRM